MGPFLYKETVRITLLTDRCARKIFYTGESVYFQWNMKVTVIPIVIGAFSH